MSCPPLSYAAGSARALKGCGEAGGGRHDPTPNAPPPPQFKGAIILPISCPEACRKTPALTEHANKKGANTHAYHQVGCTSKNVGHQLHQLLAGDDVLGVQVEALQEVTVGLAAAQARLHAL
eukprot:1158921-Pelagomonas_calceolata.AAC.10